MCKTEVSVYAGMRITLQKHFPDVRKEDMEDPTGQECDDYEPGDEMKLWARCKICGRETDKEVANDATQ
jgi:hypothetical protein